MTGSGVAQVAPRAHATRRAGRPPGALLDAAPAGVSRLELGLLAAIVVAFVVAAAAIVAVGNPLGHDEAVYANQARAWLTGSTDSSWGAHRAPALPVLGVAVLVLSDSEAALRMIGIAFGVVALVGVWALGRTVGRPAAGLLAAGVFALSAPALDAGALFLTDLPAAALLLWVAVVLWRQLSERAAPGWGLLAVGGLTAGAFYLRYGSALPIVLLGLTAAASWWPQVRRHWRLVVLTGGLFALLLTPHALGAVAEFGAPWGRVLYTADAAADGALGEGLITYVRDLPYGLAGPLAGALMTLGAGAAVAGLARAAVARPADAVAQAARVRHARRWALLGVPAGAHVGIIGLGAPADERFVLAPIALLCVAGAVAAVDGLAWLGARAGDGGAAAALGAVGLVVAASAWITATDRVETAHQAGENVAVLVEASALLRPAAPDCSVLSDYYAQVEWYSGCESYRFERADDMAEPERFALLIDGGKGEPEPAERDALLAGARPLAAFDARGNVLGEAVLYRLPAAR